MLSDFTSAQRRIESIQAASKEPLIESASLRDSFLAPLTIDERNDPIGLCASGPCASSSGKLFSDKGFLSLSALDYLELLDETARITRADKAGATAMDLPPNLRAAEARCGVLETAGQGLWTTIQFGSRCSNKCVRNAESDIETPIQSETP